MPDARVRWTGIPGRPGRCEAMVTAFVPLHLVPVSLSAVVLASWGAEPASEVVAVASPWLPRPNEGVTRLADGAF